MNPTYQRATFDLERDHWWYRARQRIIVDRIRHWSGARRDLRILDIGCGGGTMLAGLRPFGDAMGIDASPEAVQQAHRLSGCLVRQGSLPNDLPADLGKFDLICLCDVLEHLDDDVAALRRVSDLLAPNGCLLITVPAIPWVFGIHDEVNEHRRRYTRHSLIQRLHDADLTCFRTSYFNAILSPLLIPAILWRNFRRRGHHFEVRCPVDPLLECVFASERFLLRAMRLPFGLSLIALASA